MVARLRVLAERIVEKQFERPREVFALLSVFP